LLIIRTTLTPSVHMESYSPDDNREYKVLKLADPCKGFDLRPFLYPSRFEHQFSRIDELAAELDERAKAGGDKAKVD
jgi:NAD+ synthase (glutamine-hydrolysing)